MKRLGYKTRFLIVALMAFCVAVSCVKDNEDIIDYDVVLAFNPAIYSPAKSAFSGTYPIDVPFGVTAVTLPVESSWHNGLSNASAFLDNEKVLPVENKWLPESLCNWPHVSKTLSAIAWSPYTAGKANFTGGVVFENVDIAQNQTDLLYTEPVTDVHKGVYGGVVALPFRHALSTIKVKAKNLVDTNEKIVIKSIKLSGIKNKGSFKSLPSPQWTLEETTVPLGFYEGSFEASQAPQSLGHTFLVIPQQLQTDFEVEFSYFTSAGTYINQTLKTRAVETLLESGRSYTYTLSVGIDEVKFMLEVIDAHLE